LVNLGIEDGELLLHLGAQLGRLVERRFESIIDDGRQALEWAQGLVEGSVHVSESAVRCIGQCVDARKHLLRVLFEGRNSTVVIIE